MNKKGFTLIEILSIIAVLGVIVTLVFPKISGTSEIQKEKEYEKYKIIVENAGKFYHSFNSDVYKVSIDKLREEKYITGELINPKTGKNMDGCVRVIRDSEGMFKYIYTSCESIEVPLEVILGDGARGQNFETKYYDSTKIDLINPTREGYEFTGWEVVKGNSFLKGNALVIGNTDTILLAKWTKNILLTAELNGGTITEEIDGAYKTGTLKTLITPIKPGYTFNGWELWSGNSIISGNSLLIGTEDTVINAMWEVIPYTITYELNGGNESISNPITYTIETETFLLNNPAKIGYTFDGWYENSSFTGNKVTQIAKGSTGNKTLYAKWTAVNAIEGSLIEDFNDSTLNNLFTFNSSGFVIQNNQYQGTVCNDTLTITFNSPSAGTVSFDYGTTNNSGVNWGMTATINGIQFLSVSQWADGYGEPGDAKSGTASHAGVVEGENTLVIKITGYSIYNIVPFIDNLKITFN